MDFTFSRPFRLFPVPHNFKSRLVQHAYKLHHLGDVIYRRNNAFDDISASK